MIPIGIGGQHTVMHRLASVQPHVVIQMRSRRGQGMFVNGDVTLLFSFLSAVMDAHGAHGLPARCRVVLAYKPVLILVAIVSNARVIWDLAVLQGHGHHVLHTVEGGLNLVRILVTPPELKHVAAIPIRANVLGLGLLVPPLYAVFQAHKQKSGR